MSEQDPADRPEPVDRVDEAMSADDGRIAAPQDLSRARETLGWSVADVAGRLRMNPRQIAALEAGQWDSLPGLAFVRGALRAYGRLLDRDIEPLLATVGTASASLELRGRAARPAVAMAGAPSYGGQSQGSRWGLGLVGLLAVIAIAFFFAPSTDRGWLRTWFQTHVEGGDATDAAPPAGERDREPTSSAQPAGDEASPSDAAVAAAAKAASSLLGTDADRRVPAAAESPAGVKTRPAPAAPAPAPAAESPPATTAGATDQAAPASAAAPPPTSAEPAVGASRTMPKAAAERQAPTAAPAPAPQAAAPAAPVAVAGSTESSPAVGPDSLVMSFRGECWVEVTGAQGKRLVYGLQKPQTSLSLSAPGPLSVLIGNADAVSVSRAGRTIDVQAVAHNGVAKLRLE